MTEEQEKLLKEIFEWWHPPEKEPVCYHVLTLKQTIDALYIYECDKCDTIIEQYA